ncbi:DUF2663 family protein [Thalassobacillus sp. C254]|uniref:DUF2663 family protein n=1 Tax=Thalassobacillus sp. C254 TaxID=1225341 RepID=UPI0006CF803D|nr:DUF2663 family protein [Thalassobacillus sp. C254]
MEQKTAEKLSQVDISPMAETLLLELVSRKEKEKAADVLVKRAGILTMISMAVLLLSIFYMQSQGHNEVLQNILVLFTVWWGQLAAVSCILGAATLITGKRKLVKAEEEFEKLREELIQRSEELWDTKERWETRHELFSCLQENYDINLFHL